MREIIRSLLLAIAVAVLAVGCSNSETVGTTLASDGEPSTIDVDQADATTSTSSVSETTAPGEADGQLTVALETLFFESFDPPAVSGPDKELLHLAYDWLVGVDVSGSFDDSQGIAESWSFSDDGLTWTAQIRDGVTFWDGTPVTAEDVAFSIGLHLDEAAISSGSADLRSVIESIETPSETEVSIQLASPDPLLPARLSRLATNEGAIVSKAHYETVGAETFGRDPMGSGPYQVVEIVPGTEIRFEAVSDHWRVGDTPYDEVLLRLVAEEQTRIGMLERAEAEIVSLSREGAAEVSARGFRTAEKPGATNLTVLYPEQWRETNPLSSPLVREALNLSIDREAIIEGLLQGQGEIFSVPLAGPAHIGFSELPLEPYAFDPVRAAELLEEAGYFDNPAQIDVYQIEFAGTPEITTIAESIANGWSTIGLNVRLVQGDWGTVRGRIPAGEVGNSVVFTSTGSRLLYPWNLVLGSEGSISTVRDPEVDAALETFSSSQTIEEYEDRFVELMTMVRDQALAGHVAAIGQVYGVGEGVPEWSALESSWPFEMSLDYLGAQE